VPCVKVNGLLRFDEAEIEAWIERCKKEGRRTQGGLISKLAGKAVEAAAGGAISGVIKKLADR
ncbi:MAG: hypothetical protein HZB83_06270, partial [Deltaproteobacteria bacterium]|nr:hypothetical protein [Deltaproteobacteria bacterium]